MEIDDWLQKFRNRWRNKQVDRVLELFADEVEYYETPTPELESKEEIRNEWRNIRSQENIEIDTEVFSSAG